MVISTFSIRVWVEFRLYFWSINFYFTGMSRGCGLTVHGSITTSEFWTKLKIASRSASCTDSDKICKKWLKFGRVFNFYVLFPKIISRIILIFKFFIYIPKIVNRPIIWFMPVLPEERHPRAVYQCPLYKISSRVGTTTLTGHDSNFVMYVLLPVTVEDSHWTRRGVALLTQLDHWASFILKIANDNVHFINRNNITMLDYTKNAIKPSYVKSTHLRS